MWKGDEWLGEFFMHEVQYACYVHILLGYKSIPNFTLSTQATKDIISCTHTNPSRPHASNLMYVLFLTLSSVFFGLVVI